MPHRLHPLTIICIGICLAAGGMTRLAHAGSLQAGAARVNITPPPEMLPIAVNGYMNGRVVSNITDPIHVKAIALGDGETTLFMCTIDSVAVDRKLMDEAKSRASKKTNVPTSHMLVSATHTHSTPATMGLLGADAVPEYRVFLTDKLAQALIAAHENMVPAELGYAVGDCAEWAHCRRWLMKPGTAESTPFTGHSRNQAKMHPGHSDPNKIKPTGPVDTSVTVLAFRTRDEEPIAVYTNYSTHYVGAPPISADYFGVFGKEMRRFIGGDEDFVGMMSNGTSGDAFPADYSRDVPRKFTHVTVGKDVAQEAYKAYKTIDFSSEIDLAAAEELLTLDVRMPTAKEVELAKDFLDREGVEGLPQGRPQVYARETVLLSQLPPTRELKLQVFRIGGLAVAAIPCETYGITGLTIKKDSPFATTMVVSIANGYLGYIPPPDQHALGGYSTWRARSSCLEVQAEPKIRNVISELLAQVTGRRTAEK